MLLPAAVANNGMYAKPVIALWSPSWRPADRVAELGSLDLMHMSTGTPHIAEHLQRFRQGDRDGAFFGLLEMGHGVLPELMAAFRSEHDGRMRAFLVEIIWQHRQRSAISFLGEALQDSAPEVWRQALDGLVTMSSPEALEVLCGARLGGHASDEFHRWLDEAIDQAESEIRGV